MDLPRLATLSTDGTIQVILIFCLSILPNHRKFEELYNSVSEAILPTITNISGCLRPCSYVEYRFNDDPIFMGVRIQYVIEEEKTNAIF